MKSLLIASFLTVFCFSNCKKDVKTEDPIIQKNDTIAKEDIVELTTPYGNLYIWLYKATPLHRENFLKLGKEGFFDQTTFHRVIPGFMIQGGDPNSKDSDPNNDGSGGPGYTIPAEIRDSIKHERGCIAAARLSDAVNPTKASSGSQFYISVSTSGTAQLDNKYTVFGIVMQGIEFADSIVKQPRKLSDPNKDRPFTDQKMTVKVLQKTLAEIQDQYNFIPKY